MQKFVFLLLLSLVQVVNAAAELTFSPLKSIYYVGECIDLNLQENLQAPSRFHRMDLWAVVQLPDSSLLFMTPYAFTPFSFSPQPFRFSLETTKRMHDILDFEVMPGLSGNYTFYAAYVKEGENPLVDASAFQSNLSQVFTTLSDEAPTVPVIDCISILPAPLNLDATPEDSQVIIRWDDVTGASSYRVYWQASDGLRDSVSVGAPSYVHGGLTNGITYSYEVAAIDATGVEGVSSLKVDAIPKAGEKPPAAPIALSVEPSDAKVIFTWQTVTGADSYIVYWQTAGGAIENLSVSDNTFTHNGLVNGMSYTYWVTAVSVMGLESAASSSLTAISQAAPPPVVVSPPVITKPTGDDAHSQYFASSDYATRQEFVDAVRTAIENGITIHTSIDGTLILEEEGLIKVGQDTEE
jgi:fibronectin type 3 domain-containing protein